MLRSLRISNKNALKNYPSSSISGLGCPISALLKLFPNALGNFPPFNQYETGAGDASTWQFNDTSDPSGAPNNWLGARTEGATIDYSRHFIPISRCLTNVKIANTICIRIRKKKHLQWTLKLTLLETAGGTSFDAGKRWKLYFHVYDFFFKIVLIFSITMHNISNTKFHTKLYFLKKKCSK